MKTKTTLIILFTLSGLITRAQSVDIGAIGKGKAFKINGGASANFMFYDSNSRESREPFTYYLNGNLNLSLYTFSMPITFSYSNQGADLDYQLPFNFNRLSLHPKYKWITAHLGHVSMSFSPYTLSGHQFTGAGIDLAPKGPFKISAMYGRLLKATEDDEDERTIPAFERMGYGLKTYFEKGKVKVGIIGFYAKDDINSITSVPEEKNVLPKENLVLSVEAGMQLTENLSFNVEYASSALTQDLRAAETDTLKNNGNLAGYLFSGRASTEFYEAIKASLNYQVAKIKLGLGYERIDPGYQTMGAYFFQNDMENITINASRPFLKEKLNLSFNIGYQKDDLNNEKTSATDRIVGAVNISYQPTEKLNITGSYSNFQTVTNMKLDQFEDINDNTTLDNRLDTLDFKQLSQNANLNVNYVFGKKDKTPQNINLNYSFSDVANERAGIVRIGQASTFHNMNAAHTITFQEKKISITTAINATYNTIGREDATTWGPTLSLSKGFFENKLNTRLSASYNSNNAVQGNTTVTSFRANASYVIKEKHNLNLNAVQMLRNGDSIDKLSEMTINLGYSYSF